MKKIYILIFTLFILIILFLFLAYIFFNDYILKKDINVASDVNTNNFTLVNEVEKEKERVLPETFNVSFDKAGYNVDDEIKDLIISFYDDLYLQEATLEYKDMRYLYSNAEESYINSTINKLIIGSRKMYSHDLSLTDAKYSLKVDSYSNTNGLITIDLLEDFVLNFAFMEEEESKGYDIKSVFVIVLDDGEYKVKSFRRVTGANYMITKEYSSSSNYIEKLDCLINKYFTLNMEKINRLNSYYNDALGNDLKYKNVDHEYDRVKAMEYSNKYIGERDSSWWSSDDNNCQNYASITLYNGGIPMDYYGSASYRNQWKMYSMSLDSSQSAKGYVTTWTCVPYFATYVENNSGYGLVAENKVNPYYAEEGDIMHVSYKSDVYNKMSHATVVKGRYEKDGKLIDLLINSNTNNYENYPFSAYNYPYFNLIKIYGWND